MGSVLLLYEPITLVAVAVFAALSLVIVRWARGKRRLRDTPSPSGVRTAAVAAIVSGGLAMVVVVPLLLIGWVLGGYPSDPVSSVLADVWLPVLVVGASVLLAVLDLYAIEPPRPGDRFGAVKRALLGQSLVLMAILVGGSVHTAIRAAAAEQALADDRAAWAAEMRAVEARSTGLSIGVTIRDVTLGETTDNGRIVSHLTLDVRVRSTTDIELRQAREGFANQVISLEPPQAPYVEITDELLPTHIGAGLDKTYRLEVPIIRSNVGQDPPTTGLWETTLSLIGPDSSLASSIDYQATTTFTVPDTP